MGKIPSTFCWLYLAKYVYSSLCNTIQAHNEPPLAAKFGIISLLKGLYHLQATGWCLQNMMTQGKTLIKVDSVTEKT